MLPSQKFSDRFSGVVLMLRPAIARRDEAAYDPRRPRGPLFFYCRDLRRQAGRPHQQRPAQAAPLRERPARPV